MKERSRDRAGGKPLRTKLGLIVVLGALVLTAAIAAAQPAPFLINGWVNCTNGDPVNDPSVTVTNLNTSEVFIAETNASSNYYQVITSSLNVSAGNVLRFVVSDNESDHPVTPAEMNAGGFEQNATIECGGPASFLLNGWVNCTNGDPVNDPSVTVTNLNTSEVFIAETNASSNYYQVITSSLNVSAGNVLRFVVSDNESDHPVTPAEMNAGGFEQNVTIECGGSWVCGDATGDDLVTMADGRRIYMHKIYEVELNCDPCEADVTGDGLITMADGRRIYMHKIYEVELNCNCP